MAKKENKTILHIWAIPRERQPQTIFSY